MTEQTGLDEVRSARRRVRRRLRIFLLIARYVFGIAILTLIDWATGGGWWVQWVALVWGLLLVVRLVAFSTAGFWGRDMEERLVRRELEWRRLSR